MATTLPYATRSGRFHRYLVSGGVARRRANTPGLILKKWGCSGSTPKSGPGEQKPLDFEFWTVGNKAGRNSNRMAPSFVLVRGGRTDSLTCKERDAAAGGPV